MRESDEEPDLDFEIMTFTKAKKQVKSQIVYTVLDYEQREHHLTIQQLEVIAKRDPDTMQLFVEWLGGPKVYEEMY